MTDPRPCVLAVIPLADEHRAAIAGHFALLYAPDDASRAAAIARDAPRIRAVLSNGSVGLSERDLAALPAVELLCALGVGYENLPLAAARARGLALANGAGTNDSAVADHAFGLLIAAVRGIVPMDRYVRAGGFRTPGMLAPGVAGRRLGLLGFGAIGQQIARRADGFSMPVGVHTRTRRDEPGRTWFASPLALAAWCEILVVATPGGAATQHLVDQRVLAALGAGGVLVNIARGSVVDTAALAAALADGTIAAAGLDVYESEPAPPAALVGLDNVVLTPHVAGWSPEAMRASVERFIANAEGHFAGRGVASAI